VQAPKVVERAVRFEKRAQPDNAVEKRKKIKARPVKPLEQDNIEVAPETN
jgi:hypothetical protein